MHSVITDDTQSAWKAFEEGDLDQALQLAEETLDHVSEDQDEPDDEDDITEPAERPPAYWDALIVKMLVQLRREEDAETWDTIEALLPCQDSDYRGLAVGMARLGEGLLIRRMDELGDQTDSQKSLEKAAQELEDRVLSFQGGIRENADPRDVFLAAFACILGTGEWDHMHELDERLEEREDLSDREEELHNAAKELLKLEQLCTPEKIQNLKDSGFPRSYQIFLELMEWGGSDLENI